jgi:esterase/lipase superfamily enzyme
MKRWFLWVFFAALLAGCATPPPDPNQPVAAQDANGVPAPQPYRTPRANIGIGLGNWGGHGFGGVGIGLGF